MAKDDLQVRLVQLLLTLPLPPATLDRISDALEIGPRTLLAMHPLRTESMFTGAYRGWLDQEIRDALLMKAPLRPAEIDFVVKHEHDTELLARLLQVAWSTINRDQAAKMLLGQEVSVPPRVDVEALGIADGNVRHLTLEELRSKCAQALGPGTVLERIGARAADLVQVNHEDDIWLLHHPEAAARRRARRPMDSELGSELGSEVGSRLNSQLGRRPHGVGELDRASRRALLPEVEPRERVCDLDDQVLPVAARWLHTRIGDAPEGWLVAFSFTGAHPSLEDLASVVDAVMAPAGPGPGETSRSASSNLARSGRVPWWRRLGAALTGQL